MKDRKIALYSELQTRYKEFFESKLAVTLLENPKFLPVVQKVSKKICALIEQNHGKILKQITENKKISEELFDVRYFGRLNNNSSDASQILNMMLNVLQTDSSNLSQVLQIHCIFSYRIYPAIAEQKPKKTYLHEHARVEISKESKLSKQLGITRNKVFSKMIGDENLEHAPALNRFIPDNKSNFFQISAGKNIPFVAGPSGHTASLMIGALSYGIKDTEELTQYALACFAFLAGGGNHSFNEVMFVANKIAEVPFKINNYSLSLSNSFKNTYSYRNLCLRFPEFIEFSDRGFLKGMIGKSTSLPENILENILDYYKSSSMKP